MRKDKQTRLENAGWKVGDAADFLELTKEQAAFVDMKVALARSLKQRRQRRHWTQTQLANAIGSSQPRVAKMEAADASVSIDLLMKALLTMGATRRDLAKVIAAPRTRSAA
jgi:DNA-binding XRE family transcriptional regulator